MQTSANQQSSNMEIWNKVRSVPSDAVTEITGGPLKGKSNINPIWRYQRLCELFGNCGEGWKIEQVARWKETTPNGDTAVFCEVNLYVKLDGEHWSAPIFGQGGNTLIRTSTEWVNGQQVTVQRIDDEAYKKAYTDAVSVACKALGFAADIYYAQEETKYGSFRGDASAQQPAAHMAPAQEQAAAVPFWPWTDGLKEITPESANWKPSVTQVSKMSDIPVDEILGRISSKFNITEENFHKLLAVSNRSAS